MSTLHPGKVSKTISDLRNAAIKEMASKEPGRLRAGKVSFDRITKGKNRTVDPENPADNFIFPGVVSPHIGNGPGGPQ